jgi:predicted nucleic acid-binding protein
VDEGTAATSRLSEVEIASALALRCREGSITSDQRDQVLDRMRADLESAFYVVEFQPEVSAAAVDLLRRHPLRAGDALQLACALTLGPDPDQPVQLLAFDERLTAAGAAEGLSVLAP